MRASTNPFPSTSKNVSIPAKPFPTLSLITSERGSVEGAAFLLLFLLTSLLALQWYSLSLRYQELDQHLKQLLCFKREIMRANQHVKIIGNLNKTLASIRGTQGILTVSILGASLAVSAEKAIKLIKIAQNAQHVSYLKNILAARSLGCRIPLLWLKTPYQHTGLLKRNSLGLVEGQTERSILWKLPLNIIKLTVDDVGHMDHRLQLHLE